MLALYDHALPEVYGYLLSRCHDVKIAEDLRGDTFLAAVSGVRRGAVRAHRGAWLIAVARNKLVDHWRRLGGRSGSCGWSTTRTTAHLTSGTCASTPPSPTAYSPISRPPPGGAVAALPRRPVGAGWPTTLGRTLSSATEALLVRKRAAFRRAYETGAG